VKEYPRFSVRQLTAVIGGSSERILTKLQSAGMVRTKRSPLQTWCQRFQVQSLTEQHRRGEILGPIGTNIYPKYRGTRGKHLLTPLGELRLTLHWFSRRPLSSSIVLRRNMSYAEFRQIYEDIHKVRVQS